MLLKKQEKDNKIKAMYSSSTIAASIYDKEKSELTNIRNNKMFFFIEAGFKSCR